MSDVVKKYMYLALKINHTVECAQKHDANSFFMIFFYVWKIQLILEDLRCIYVTENHHSKSDEDLSVHVLPTSPRGSG